MHFKFGNQRQVYANFVALAGCVEFKWSRLRKTIVLNEYHEGKSDQSSGPYLIVGRKEWHPNINGPGRT